MHTAANSSTDNELARYLRKHELYDGLYEPLKDFTLQDLIILKMVEVERFAEELKLKLKQKLQFRRLMKMIISERDKIEISSKMFGVKPDDKMTVVLVGDMGVGKTNLIRKYVSDIFVEQLASTVGVDQALTIQKMSDNTNMEITIWDTAGQERLQSIGRAYYRRADCILYCYDLSIQDPFRNVDHWRKQIGEHGKDGVLVMLIGCKYDIAPNGDGTTGNRKKVQEILQQEEWKKFQPISVECSAKTNHNVNGVFLACAELVLKDRKSPKIGNHQRVRPKPITLAPASQPAKSGGCCG